MAYKLGNRVKMSVSGTPGTGTITLGSAVSGFNAFGDVLSNSDTCPYVIEDGVNWEIGVGTYTSSGTTLARTSVTASSAGGTTKISATSNAYVMLAPLAADYVLVSDPQDFTGAAPQLRVGKANTTLGAVKFYGSTSGDVTVQPNAVAGSSVTLTLPASSDTLIGKATTDTLTNKTFDTAGTGNVFKINGTAVSDKTGSGKAVLDTSPSLTTPDIGVATATSVNKVALTAPATGSTLTIADGKTLTVNHSLTLAGTDSTTQTFPSISASIAGLSVVQSWTATQTFKASSSSINLGENGGNLGVATFYGSTSGTVAVKAAAAAGTGTVFQLPSSNGTNKYALTSDGSGGTSWAQIDVTAAITGTLPVANGGTGITSFGTGVATAFGNAVNATGGLITFSSFAPASGKTLTVSNSLTLAGTDSTTMTFPSTSSTILAAGKETIWIPAASMTARTTNGATSGSLEIATNLENLSYYSFDSSTTKYVQFNIHMPKGWNEGTVLAQFVWTHPSTTTNFGVNWNIQGYAFSDGDNISAAFGSAQNVDDTGGNTNYCYISSATSAVTIGGTPAENDWVIFQVYRNPSATNDTMAVNAYLLGVKLIYTTDAANDN